MRFSVSWDEKTDVQIQFASGRKVPLAVINNLLSVGAGHDPLQTIKGNLFHID
jgi:hypothetical protein